MEWGNSLRSSIHGPLQRDEENLLVVHVWHDNNWNFSSLSFKLPDDFLNQCLSVPTPDPTLVSKDFMYSYFTSLKKIDFSRAMKVRQNDRNCPTNAEVSYFWKVETLPIVKKILFG